MRSKAPLALMEQLVMILVFALAAALCLQIFVFADRLSARNEETDNAVLVCQNAAETLKAAGRSGDALPQGTLTVYYDVNWQPTRDPQVCSYLLRTEMIPSPVPGLCQAALRVERAGETTSQTPLFELTVAWQEVDPHE